MNYFNKTIHIAIQDNWTRVHFGFKFKFWTVKLINK